MGWNLRSRAASFSIYFLYSSMVVAPISCSSPLAREGFRMLLASMAPSAPPAPMIVWISSMNRSTSPDCMTSCSTRLIRSSNSPRYLDPAIMPDRSSVTTRFPWIVSGTSPATISWARPSTTAVFPTPGSPIRQGLFFVLLERICITRCISMVRPMTGSSFPAFASSVRSLEYWSRVGVRLSWGALPGWLFTLPAGSWPGAPPSSPMEPRIST